MPPPTVTVTSSPATASVLLVWTKIWLLELAMLMVMPSASVAWMLEVEPYVHGDG